MQSTGVSSHGFFKSHHISKKNIFVLLYVLFVLMMWSDWGEVLKWVKILDEVQKNWASDREGGLLHLLYPLIFLIY